MTSKRSICILVLSGLALFCSAGVSRAEKADEADAGAQGQAQPWNGPKADRNHDGKIDDTERQQAKEMWAKLHPKKDKLKTNADTNGDGTIDKTEKKQAIETWKEKHGDQDNNPPGMAGGPGTNWENPAGPKGGPGAGPNFNGGNPPGPQGGPGAGPRFDKDNNPPGPQGGRGTNWENPAGPKGGPGASPNVHGPRRDK